MDEERKKELVYLVAEKLNEYETELSLIRGCSDSQVHLFGYPGGISIKYDSRGFVQSGVSDLGGEIGVERAAEWYVDKLNFYERSKFVGTGFTDEAVLAALSEDVGAKVERDGEYWNARLKSGALPEHMRLIGPD